MTPRAEIRDMLRRIAAASVPHLGHAGQISYLASKMSAQSGRPIGTGTVKDFWYALDDDERRVDSRHMDWARSRDPKRSAAANDNAGYRLPCRSEVIGVAA